MNHPQFTSVNKLTGFNGNFNLHAILSSETHMTESLGMTGENFVAKVLGGVIPTDSAVANLLSFSDANTKDVTGNKFTWTNRRSSESPSILQQSVTGSNIGKNGETFILQFNKHEYKIVDQVVAEGGIDIGFVKDLGNGKYEAKLLKPSDREDGINGTDILKAGSVFYRGTPSVGEAATDGGTLPNEEIIQYENSFSRFRFQHEITDFGYGELSNSQVQTLLGLEKDAMQGGYSPDMMKKIIGNSDLNNAFHNRNKVYHVKNGDKSIMFFLRNSEFRMLEYIKKSILRQVLYGENYQDTDANTDNVRFNMGGIRYFLQKYGVNYAPHTLNIEALSNQLRDIYQSRISTGTGACIALLTGQRGIGEFNKAVASDLNLKSSYRINHSAFMQENNNQTVANIRNYTTGLTFTGYETWFGAKLLVIHEPLFDNITFTNNRKASYDMFAVPIDNTSTNPERPLSGLEIKMGGYNNRGVSFHEVIGTALERGSGNASHPGAYDIHVGNARASLVMHDPTNGLWVNGGNISG